MPIIYHGSKSIFDKPNFDFIENKVSYGTNEYGFGLYGSMYHGDAQGILSGSNSSFGIVYQIDVDDCDFKDRWLKSSEPIGADKFERLLEMASEKNYENLSTVLIEYGENTTGQQVMMAETSDNPRQYSADLHETGIDGYSSGDYCVFLSENSINNMKVVLSKGIEVDKANAYLDHLRNKETVIIEEPYKKHGFEDNGRIAIESFGSQQVADVYCTIISIMRSSTDNYGYDMRLMLNNALSNMYSVDSKNPEKIFGVTNLNNIDKRIRDSYGFSEGLTNEQQSNLTKNLKTLISKLSDNPYVLKHIEQAEMFQQSETTSTRVASFSL